MKRILAAFLCVWALASAGFLLPQSIPAAQASSLKKNHISCKEEISHEFSDVGLKLKLRASCKGGAKLTYRTNNSRIKVSSGGTITVPRNFVGVVKITVTSSRTKEYCKTEKKVMLYITPKAPKIKTVTNPSKGTLRLTWKATVGATEYKVGYSSTSEDPNDFKWVKASSTTSCTLTGLKKGKTYYVTVMATVKKMKAWRDPHAVILTK